MDPWEHIRRAAADRRSGSAAVAARAARGMRELTTQRDVMRAARRLLRAHPAMASLWRLCAAAVEGDDPGEAARRYADRLETTSMAAADAVRWVVRERRAIVVTHSSSSSVVDALDAVRGRVEAVVCTASLPGGEGRVLARRLRAAGFEAEVVPDAAMASACATATVALAGADAVTPDGVVNKVGTRLLALAARDAGIGFYVVAPRAKLLPEILWRAEAAPAFDATPLELAAAIVTERGAERAGTIRRAARAVTIPERLRALTASRLS